MKRTTVAIVGAGPSGLAMGLALAKHKIKSVILEKECEIDHDPRGVYLNGDAVRILYDLGLQNWDSIGHEPKAIHFHRSSFKNKPFYVVDTADDFLGQAVPNGFLHVQPKLEAALVTLVEQSAYCHLQRGCTVDGRTSNGNSIVISYTSADGSREFITSSWLIGADGKKGIVRKHFLEPTAGIKQENTGYRYDGTWIAANLRISLPTSQTHPHLPFWSTCMTPEDVYDLYWPKDWHFCQPPQKATASGRFGPFTERIWRHEFAEPGWNDSMDATSLLWENIDPMITHSSDGKGKLFDDGPRPYPRDCIEILRCRPFTFTHKVVNRWFHERVVLIGDAAHVFPPFGGEGIASGIRDAHQLAWRIALSERAALEDHTVQQLLMQWMIERRQGIKNAADFTKLNGTLCNEPEGWSFWLFRNLESLLKKTSLISLLPHPRTVIEAKGYRGLTTGCFLPEYGGGGKLAQIFVRPGHDEATLSDIIINHTEGLLTLFVLKSGHVDAALGAIEDAGLPSCLLSAKSVLRYDDADADDIANESVRSVASITTIRPATPSTPPGGYSSNVFGNRLRKASTAYAIVRPDFYIFALLKTAGELRHALAELKAMVSHENSGRSANIAAKL